MLHADLLAISANPRYAPRPEPLPIPAERWDEGVIKTIQMNRFWIGHILGALEVLDQYDAWTGTDEEIDDARQQVNEIMASVQEAQLALFVGFTTWIPAADVPAKWLLLDGSAISRTDYAELFAFLGVLWGAGNGSTTFNLPDMRGRSPMAAGMPAGGDISFNVGDLAGQQKHALSAAENGQHTHQLQNNAGAASWRHTGTGGARASLAATNGTTNSNSQMVTEASGTGQPHNTIHPVLVGNYIIYAGVD